MAIKQLVLQGVCSDVNPYGVEGNLIFSFPCRSKGDGEYEIVGGLPWDDFLKEKMRKTGQELKEEREMVGNLMQTVP